MPSIRPKWSISAARTEAPPPFETLEPMTMVLAGKMPALEWCRLSWMKANRMDCKTSMPHSASGFCWEWADLRAFWGW